MRVLDAASSSKTRIMTPPCVYDATFAESDLSADPLNPPEAQLEDNIDALAALPAGF